MLKSPTKTILAKDAPVKELKFELSGNMNRYVWSLDNKVVSETDKILIKKGETVRMVLFNGSMMRHPMHLHGHDFRVLNGQEEFSPLKNVIDIMPMETDTLEFAATESGDWFLIDFYEALGAKPMNEWTVYRLSGEALEKLAREKLANE